jgi:hypothetical protein
MDETLQRNQLHGSRNGTNRLISYAILAADAREKASDAAAAGSAFHSC